MLSIVMDSFRVNGELFAPGVPRRLVDILNSNDMTYFIMNSGTLDDPLNPEAETHTFDVIQLERSGILFAIPRGELHKPDPFELVRKKRVHSTVVLQGYAATGQLHLLTVTDPYIVPNV